MNVQVHRAFEREPVAAGAERKVNVLIVASSLWIGGAETVIRHLAETIDRQRFNVTVCYLKQRGHVGEELARQGIDIVGIVDSPGTAPPKVDYFTFRKLLRIIRARRIQVVHSHTTQGLADASLCKLLTPGLKLVHTFHFGNYPHTQPRLMWLERVFSRLANRLFSVGEVQRRQLKSVFRFRDRTIKTIWNGVTMPGPGDPSFRTRVGADGRILVGTLATLIEQKGLRDLMMVARRIRDRRSDVRFVVVGEGHLRAELEALRRDLALEDTVALPGWVTNAADVAVPTFDIFFQPSLWEAMSVAVLEAMAAGRPVVATRVGENPSMIDHATNGMLVDAGDISGMSETLLSLLDDVDLRIRLGRAARRKVEQHFTVTRMTREYEEVYLDILR